MESTNMAVHVNELLCYITHSKRAGNIKGLINIIKNTFGDEDIKEGKELLWKLRGGLLGNFTNRVRSVTRTAKEANIDDIISAISDLDASNKLPEFVAMDLDKLPGVQPEDLNIFYYIDRMASMETQLKQHTDEIISLKRHISELNDDKQLHRDETNLQKEDIIKTIRDLSQVK